MNERIREFAEQAFIVTTGGNIGHVNEYMIENFAELIVKECVHTVRNRGGMCGALASNWIEEHFGLPYDL